MDRPLVCNPGSCNYMSTYYVPHWEKLAIYIVVSCTVSS